MVVLIDTAPESWQSAPAPLGPNEHVHPVVGDRVVLRLDLQCPGVPVKLRLCRPDKLDPTEHLATQN